MLQGPFYHYGMLDHASSQTRVILVGEAHAACRVTHDTIATALLQLCETRDVTFLFENHEECQPNTTHHDQQPHEEMKEPERSYDKASLTGLSLMMPLLVAIRAKQVESTAPRWASALRGSDPTVSGWYEQLTTPIMEHLRVANIDVRRHFAHGHFASITHNWKELCAALGTKQVDLTTECAAMERILDRLLAFWKNCQWLATEMKPDNTDYFSFWRESLLPEVAAAFQILGIMSQTRRTSSQKSKDPHLPHIVLVHCGLRHTLILETLLQELHFQRRISRYNPEVPLAWKGYMEDWSCPLSMGKREVFKESHEMDLPQAPFHIEDDTQQTRMVRWLLETPRYPSLRSQSLVIACAEHSFWSFLPSGRPIVVWTLPASFSAWAISHPGRLWCNFRSLLYDSKHTIWLLDAPPSETFQWQAPLPKGHEDLSFLRPGTCESLAIEALSAAPAIEAFLDCEVLLRRIQLYRNLRELGALQPGRNVHSQFLWVCFHALLQSALAFPASKDPIMMLVSHSATKTTGEAANLVSDLRFWFMAKGSHIHPGFQPTDEPGITRLSSPHDIKA